jgi:hypothetical protein
MEEIIYGSVHFQQCGPFNAVRHCAELQALWDSLFAQIKAIEN